MPEVARAILTKPGGMELRQDNPTGFAEAMLAHELAAFEMAGQGGGVAIFDRGFPDIVGFLDLADLPVPASIDQACRELRYEGPIFHAPPWREIYVSDAQRIQTWEEALESDVAVMQAWRRYGYELTPLPLVDVAARLAFIQRAINEHGS